MIDYFLYGMLLLLTSQISALNLWPQCMSENEIGFTDPSKVVLIESEEHFNDSLRKVQGILKNISLGNFKLA